MTTQDFSVEACMAIRTGHLLKEDGFEEMHTLAAHLLGHPIWTHEFAEEALSVRLRDALLAQHPALRDAEAYDVQKAKQNLPRYLKAYVERLKQKYGATLPIKKGSASRRESPVESARRIMPDKPIIEVNVHEPEKGDKRA